MIRIEHISINRFRSILSLDMEITMDSNLIALCGRNNVGKTNTLRAINIFFNPENYDTSVDIPKIKNATGGQAVHSKIEIIFYDDIKGEHYCIARNLKDYSLNSNGLSGYSYKLRGKQKIEKKKKLSKDIEEFLNRIEFVYIESINVFMPELIKNLTEGMIDVQYNRTRFTESKKNLKESYDAYVNGLQEILDSFSNEVSDVFKSFQDSWSVNFNVPQNSDSFRDLISDDVTLSLNDNGSEGILDKGAGLQRLATILLNFEMLKRMNRNKQIIVCIDEPDVYLHEGLQRKLKKFFDKKSEEMQLFYTTHSKVFINSYIMRNVFLLDVKNYTQYSVRKQKNIYVMETYLVDIIEEEGYERICNHLGIEQVQYELLQKHNMLVEGDCDKRYLNELGNYFSLTIPNIISLNGADNAIKYLNFYNSYYNSETATYKPIVKVLFDNDPKGRDNFKKIKEKQFNSLEVQCYLLQNYDGIQNQEMTGNFTNIEIEDFMYPEIICFLINKLLSKKNMKKIDTKKVIELIKTKSFQMKGILELCEHEKNSNNPDMGTEISFVSSGGATKGVKEGLAGFFTIQANPKILRLLKECDNKHPKVLEELKNLFDFCN